MIFGIFFYYSINKNLIKQLKIFFFLILMVQFMSFKKIFFKKLILFNIY